MSSKHSYDGDDSDKSDSLICGFGPRRGHTESIDDSTAVGGASARYIDVKEDGDVLNASLICGFGGGDGNSFSSSGQSTGSGDMLAALMEHEMNAKTINEKNDQTRQQLGNGDHSNVSPRADENGLGAASKNSNMDGKNERDEVSRNNNAIRIEHVPFTVPTKIEEGGLRRGVPRVSSSRSIGSEGGLSMASEDAIVLMINMLENSDDGSNDAKNDKREDEIIGRVYKTKPNGNYDSIPIELEINANWESMVSPPTKQPGRHKQNRRGSDGVVGGATSDKNSLDKRLRRSSDGMLAATMAVREEERRQSSSPTVEPKPPKTALRAEPIIDNPLPKPQSVEEAMKSPVRHVSINNNVEQIDKTNSEHVKSYTVGFPAVVEPIQTRRRSSGMDVALDVIAEDESDDSTAANSILKSSLTSKNSSKQASQSAAVAYEDVIDEDSFRMPAAEPLGEHAKSMAMQLGMVDRPKRKMGECDFYVQIC